MNPTHTAAALPGNPTSLAGSHTVWLLLLAASCSGKATPPATTDDTASTDTASPPPEWFDQPWVDALSFPADAGLAWQIDEDFALPGFTVPVVLVATDGTWRMFLTDMDNHGRIGMLRSDDGVDWTTEAQEVLSPDDFDGACGDRLIDSAVAYLDDGSYRLVVEPWNKSDEVQRAFCSATSPDADTWTPEVGPVWAGTDNDFGTLSVPELLRMPDGRWFLYYLGDLAGMGGQDQGDGVRVAASDDGGRSYTALATSNVLDSHDTDPYPVFLDDGRIRLYHTHPVYLGRLGASDSEDGLSFPSSRYLEGLDPDQPQKEMWLDPVALHLPDGRLALYFTRIHEEAGEISLSEIGRAWAVDL